MIVHRSYAGNPDGLGAASAQSAGSQVYATLAMLSMAASTYHGYRRNVNGEHPIAWALAWGFMGSLFPVIVPVIAVAQGYGKPEGK